MLPCAKLQAVIFAYVGLLAGILYSFGGFIVDLLVTLGWITTTETPGLSYGTVLAFGALLGMPVIFVVFGFFTGVIGALLFNCMSRWWGWIDFDVG